MSEIVVFTARKIRTMNESLPEATAVAVRDGKIIEVGTLETIKPWLESHPHRIDTRFKNHIIMPGFIDPHLHPSLGATLLPCHFITAMEWKLPDRVCPPVTSHEAYLERLTEIERGIEDKNEPLITWGYHKIWHGRVHRTELNRVSSTRPIIVWQRSFHEIIANDAAIDWMSLDRTELERHPQIELETGRFYETGLGVATRAMNPFLLSPARFGAGLELVKKAIHQGGHTTIGELAFPLLDDALEWDVLTKSIERDNVPFRMRLVPRAVLRGTWNGATDEAVERVNSYQARGLHRLSFGNGVKLFADGGFFAELMQMLPPGFIDGHHGEWMTAPETFEALARAFWNDGKQVHVHCTGDMGLELALDVLEKLQFERPRFNHRFTIEHFGVSTPEQARRIADLGAIVSANVYYVHELGEAYWRSSIGHERASQMARLGTLNRLGVTTALHSDFTMAPAEPLNSAWVAVNRIAESGAVLGPQERISLDAAMRAITIDAAYVLGMEHEVGSIRAGKCADFTVLEADPWETPVENLKDIPIWGTVFEGRPYPLKSV
ncbi:amidohydrolase [Hoeflea sp. AS60]|uniref:amidohydrolase n=1 Tax=Hoeflea sp. AS60 TaxID=3135780 RepID=UPI0031765DF9